VIEKMISKMGGHAMTLYDQLKEKKELGLLKLNDLTEETLEILYWNENLIKSMIADLFDVDKKFIDSKIRMY
jgi:hypothetical protein